MSSCADLILTVAYMSSRRSLLDASDTLGLAAMMARWLGSIPSGGTRRPFKAKG